MKSTYKVTNIVQHEHGNNVQFSLVSPDENGDTLSESASLAQLPDDQLTNYSPGDLVTIEVLPSA